MNNLLRHVTEADKEEEEKRREEKRTMTGRGGERKSKKGANDRKSRGGRG